MVASVCLFCDFFLNLSNLYYHCSDADIIKKMKVLLKSEYMNSLNVAFFAPFEHHDH